MQYNLFDDWSVIKTGQCGRIPELFVRATSVPICKKSCQTSLIVLVQFKHPYVTYVYLGFHRLCCFSFFSKQREKSLSEIPFIRNIDKETVKSMVSREIFRFYSCVSIALIFSQLTLNADIKMYAVKIPVMMLFNLMLF